MKEFTSLEKILIALTCVLGFTTGFYYDQCVTQLRQCNSAMMQIQDVMKRCKLYCGPERKLPRI